MNSYRIWSIADEAKLKKIYPVMPIEDVARIFGLTEKGVYSKAYRLGLKKNERKTPLPQSKRRGVTAGAALTRVGNSLVHRIL